MKDLLEKNVQIKHNQELNSLEVTFIGFVPYDTMVKTLEYEYQMIRYYKLGNCMIDLRKMGIYAPGVGDLVKNQWFKHVQAEGVRRVAFIVPESSFGQLSMNKAHESVKKDMPLQVEYFQNLATAREWIMSTQVVKA